MMATHPGVIKFNLFGYGSIEECYKRLKEPFRPKWIKDILTMKVNDLKWSK